MSPILGCPVKLSVFTYLIIALLLIMTKPELLFTEEGEVRGFGCKEGNHCLNLPVVLYLSAVVITFFFEWLCIQKQAST